MPTRLKDTYALFHVRSSVRTIVGKSGSRITVNRLSPRIQLAGDFRRHVLSVRHDDAQYITLGNDSAVALPFLNPTFSQRAMGPGDEAGSALPLSCTLSRLRFSA